MPNTKKVAIIGSSSYLSKEIKSELKDFLVTDFGRKVEYKKNRIDVTNISASYIEKVFFDNYDIYIFNLGLILPKNIVELSEKEIFNSLKINALFTICSCEHILRSNDNARIFIIGSESGRKGSYDTTYFLSKTMLRSYVKQRYLHSQEQQILLISPSTIGDSKMTLSRDDKERLDAYALEHPKGSFVSNKEISMYLSDIIKNESTYLSNTEIEINGGKFARMKYPQL